MLRAALFLSLLLFAAFATQAEAARQLVTLHTFCSEADCADGQFPGAGLVRDARGDFYGTASQGGAHGQGVIYELDKQGKQFVFKVVHSFCRDCGEGWLPGAGLIVDVDGNLYGTTGAGGPKDCGTVFELKRRKLITLHAFCATDDDGNIPVAGVTYAGQASGAPYDGTSPLYGATGDGGTHNLGAVFKLTRNGKGKWKAKTLYSFCSQAQCADGLGPSGEVSLDGAGNLYGVTSFGGISNGGVIYKIAPTGESTLWKFCLGGCESGANPSGPLLRNEQGHLTGTTLNTTSENGNVYEFDGGGIHILHTFCSPPDCTDGYAPSAGVVTAGGVLYGTTSLGGTGENGVGAGTVFQIFANTFTTLYDFCSKQNCTDGRIPEGQLALDPVGNLFGITAQGGNGSGTVFELKQ